MKSISKETSLQLLRSWSRAWVHSFNVAKVAKQYAGWLSGAMFGHSDCIADLAYSLGLATRVEYLRNEGKWIALS